MLTYGVFPFHKWFLFTRKVPLSLLENLTPGESIPYLVPSFLAHQVLGFLKKFQTRQPFKLCKILRHPQSKNVKTEMLRINGELEPGMMYTLFPSHERSLFTPLKCPTITSESLPSSQTLVAAELQRVGGGEDGLLSWMLGLATCPGLTLWAGIVQAAN